jgi:hypothetical protein
MNRPMMRTANRSIATPFIFCFILASPRAFAVDDPKLPARDTKFRYELVIKPERSGMEVGAGVFFDARFYNDSDKPVRIPWKNTLFEDIFRFTVTGPDSKPLAGPTDRFAPPVLSDPEELVVVEPGKMVTYVVVIGSIGRNGQQWYFRKPGQYSVKAFYQTRRDLYSEPAREKEVPAPDGFVGMLEAPPVQFTLVRSVRMPSRILGTLTIEGHVRDEQGKPVPGADVEIDAMRHNDPNGLSSVIGPWITSRLDRVRTDSEGRFVIDELPNGMARFALRARHPLYVPAKLEVSNEPPIEKEAVTLQLTKGIDVRGRVVDAEGNAVPGAIILDYADLKTVFTDAEGRFRMFGVKQPPTSLQIGRQGFVAPEFKIAPGYKGAEQTTIIVREAKSAAPQGERGR